jgi:hypothetical protein
MGRIWRTLGQSTTAATTFTTLGGTPSSPFTPDFNGTLKGIRLISTRNTASSLIDFTEVRITCANFSPNTITVGIPGTGLQTAPAQLGEHVDFEVDQPVIAGVPIVLESRNTSTSTPVTPSIFVFGLFDTK